MLQNIVLQIKYARVPKWRRLATALAVRWHKFSRPCGGTLCARVSFWKSPWGSAVGKPWLGEADAQRGATRICLNVSGNDTCPFLTPA